MQIEMAAAMLAQQRGLGHAMFRLADLRAQFGQHILHRPGVELMRQGMSKDTGLAAGQPAVAT